MGRDAYRRAKEGGDDRAVPRTRTIPDEGCLEAIVEALVPPGGRVALAEPTGDALRACIPALGRVYVDVGRRHDLRIDLAGLDFVLRHDPDVALVYAATPDPPTGTGLSARSLASLARRPPQLVIDRRYAADGGWGEGRTEPPGALVLRGWPGSAPPSGRRAVLSGPALVVDLVADRWQGPDPGWPSLMAMEAWARSSRVEERAARALRAALRRVPGLLVAPGSAAWVYVRIPGVAADALAMCVRASGAVVTAFRGALHREGVRVEAPRSAAGRRAVVDAVRGALTAARRA